MLKLIFEIQIATCRNIPVFLSVKIDCPYCAVCTVYILVIQVCTSVLMYNQVCSFMTKCAHVSPSVLCCTQVYTYLILVLTSVLILLSFV